MPASRPPAPPRHPSLAFVACAAAAWALGAAPAWADDSNFRPYVVGSRAAGMGGAFTALSDDGSGPYYNPGGIAFVRRSQLSLSGSVYGLVTANTTDALGTGRDFSQKDLNIFPVATSAVWKFGGSPDEAETALAASVFTPDAINLDDRDSLGSKANAFFASTQEQTVWTGLTLAHRFGRLGLGASAFFLFGTSINTLDLTASPGTALSKTFVTITGRMDQTVFGGVGAVGARWDVTDQVRVGASFYTPEVGGGSRRSFVRVTRGDAADPANTAMAVDNVDDLHASPTLPMRAQLGLAFTSGELTLSLDGIYLGARDVTDDADRQRLSRHVLRNAVVNGAVGAEYVVNDSFPLRAGFFTDFAASHDQSTGLRDDLTNTAHVNRVGGTLAIGYRSEHSSTDIGFNLSGGSGSETIPDNLDFQKAKATSYSQRNLYVFLASSYQF